jgi:hypothetical protein
MKYLFVNEILFPLVLLVSNSVLTVVSLKQRSHFAHHDDCLVAMEDFLSLD